jgi:AhpD family alkylhydroperoxidase
MTSLDRRTARLIAVGASVAANCQACLKTTAAKAAQGGIKDEEIAEAVEIGKMVRHCAASQIDESAASLGFAGAASSFQKAPVGECECVPRKKIKGASSIPDDQEIF